jgi:hypothetical protein
MIRQSALGVRGYLIRCPQRCAYVFRVFSEPDPVTGRRPHRDYDLDTDVIEIEITSDHHKLARPEACEKNRARVVDHRSKDVPQAEPGPRPQIMEDQGYRAFVWVDLEECILRGKVINTRRSITFQGKTVAALMQAFHDAVENDLEWCNQMGWRPKVSTIEEPATS